ncbi:MAG: ABC transporter substrate-binding protein [Lachnospiraceae bacterium]|nr:ABC transporter substrate-binding protein [Lachnospiraceae bacterium]
MKRNVIYGLAVTGCAMALTVSTRIGAVAAEDTIVIGNTSIIDTVDPVHNGSNAWSLTADGVSETVFMQDKDGNLVSRFVDSIEQKDDLTWEIKLKSGVKFSDGTDVDAQAFCDSMNSIMQNNEMASSSAGMITFTATDDATVTLTTERETTVMPSVLCEYNMVVCKDNGDSSYVFTGPYVIDSMDPGVELDLVPNEYYDDRAADRSNVVIKGFSDAATMQQAFESGEIDMAFTVTPETAGILQGEGYTTKDFDAGYQYFMVVNSKENETLSDLKLRQAINVGINREDMVTALKGGRVANGFFAQYYSFAGDVQETYDPEQAKSLLEEAGYTDTDGDGFVDKDGEKLTLKLVTYPSRPDLSVLMQLVVSELNDIGIDATTEMTDSIGNYVKTEEFDIAFWAQHTAPTGEPTYSLSQFFRTGAAYNNNEYSNEKVDALLDQMGALPAGEEKDNLAKQVQQIISEDLPVIYLVDPQWHIAVSDKLANYEPYNGDYYVVNAELGLN